MPDLSVLLAYLPDFGAWWRALQTFAGDNLPWVLLGLTVVGWLLTGLIVKWSVKLVFGVIWSGVKFIVYWAFLWPLTRIGYGVWVVFKWLGRLFGRGAKASGRGVKALGRKGKTGFKHHPWWGVGLLLVGAMFLQAAVPYNYPGRQDVDVLLWWLTGFYFFIMAFVRFMSYALHRRTGRRG